MARIVKVTNRLLCEHVSAGPNNKHTLINVFSGDIVVSDLPALLPFGLYIETDSDPGFKGHLNLEIRWRKRPYMKGVVRLEQRSPSRQGVIALASFQLPVERDGELEVWLGEEGTRLSKILSKRIYKGVIETPTS